MPKNKRYPTIPEIKPTVIRAEDGLELLSYRAGARVLGVTAHNFSTKVHRGQLERVVIEPAYYVTVRSVVEYMKNFQRGGIRKGTKVRLYHRGPFVPIEEADNL